MDCFDPVDDYCYVWRSNYNLETSGKIPKEYENKEKVFSVRLEVERIHPLTEDGDDEEIDWIDLPPDATQRDSYTFWRSCLDEKVISQMLTEVGIRSHKQEFMIDRISKEADRITKDFSGVEGACKILSMHVLISFFPCCGFWN